MSTNTETILNATLLAPAVKHATIFAQFHALAKGDSFILQNDHDPVPLHFQFNSEFGDTFGWEYLENGPEWFKIRITKGGSSIQDETLGEIAVKNISKALVFKKLGLDFCCGGKKTIKQACAEKGLDPALVEEELQQADNSSVANALPYNDWNLDFLADFIVNTHHSFVRKRLPDLIFYAEKVSRKHGPQHLELNPIYQLVLKIGDELSSHMVKEENVLFPYIKNLAAISANPERKLDLLAGSVLQPINMMIAEHEQVGAWYEEIQKLSSGYTLPEDACGSYNLYYRLLEEFEDDLHLHIHLENNILFPKALALEAELKKRN